MTTPDKPFFAPAFVLAFLACLAAGAIWNVFAPAGPWLALVPVVAVPFGQRWWSRWSLAVAYYLAGSTSIVPSAASFFGAHALGAGLAAWVGSALLLALPWVLACGPVGVLAAVLIDAVPPFGLIGWLSPLTAAGVLFPGTALAGLVLCLLLIVALGALARHRGSTVAWSVILFTAGSAIGCVSTFTPPGAPDGWAGVNTSVLPSGGDVIKAIENNQKVIAAALEQGKGERVVVLPEAVLDDWWPGTQAQFAAAVPPGQLWLIGAEAQGQERSDAVVAARRGQAEPDPVFRSALPMPGTMWRPGSALSYRAAWWEPVRIIGGQRVWASICFDQVLPWVWFEGLIQHPNIVILQANAWWAKRWNPAPAVQAAQAEAWVNLTGAKAVLTANEFGVYLFF
jgi:hypothetical protein